jgi:hypothetical protein
MEPDFDGLANPFDANTNVVESVGRKGYKIHLVA